MNTIRFAKEEGKVSVSNFNMQTIILFFEYFNRFSL
jgi:hypothetical protein